MTDIKRRTLRMWAEADKQLSIKDFDPKWPTGPLMAWADAKIELQILKELEANGGLRRLREGKGSDGV